MKTATYALSGAGRGSRYECMYVCIILASKLRRLRGRSYTLHGVRNGILYLFVEVETLESSERSAPGRAEEGTWLSGERRHGTGEAKTASPRPLLTATPTFPVPRAAGEGPARHWEGAFKTPNWFAPGLTEAN